ncbi:secretoglobin family 3A member 2 [Caretta caretta]|uniref:secretoglobin family 3A member 2 n=1 Tax=Caretta caretta TaxID=8467 RepID=UPI003F4BDBB0
MKLTVVFTLVTLALCCYSASAVLSVAGSLVSNLVPNVMPNRVPVPFSVLTDLVGGVQGCVNQLTPKALSALHRVLVSPPSFSPILKLSSIYQSPTNLDFLLINIEWKCYREKNDPN